MSAFCENHSWWDHCPHCEKASKRDEQERAMLALAFLYDSRPALVAECCRQADQSGALLDRVHRGVRMFREEAQKPALAEDQEADRG